MARGRQRAAATLTLALALLALACTLPAHGAAAAEQKAAHDNHNNHNQQTAYPGENERDDAQPHLHSPPGAQAERGGGLADAGGSEEGLDGEQDGVAAYPTADAAASTFAAQYGDEATQQGNAPADSGDDAAAAGAQDREQRRVERLARMRERQAAREAERQARERELEERRLANDRAADEQLAREHEHRMAQNDGVDPHEAEAELSLAERRASAEARLQALRDEQRERTQRLAENAEARRQRLNEQLGGTGAAEEDTVGGAGGAGGVQRLNLNLGALADAAAGHPAQPGTHEGYGDDAELAETALQEPEPEPEPEPHPAEPILRSALAAKQAGDTSTYHGRLLEAVAQKHPEAVTMLATHMLVGNTSVERDAAAAFQLVQEPAQEGFPQAQWLLGFMYSMGVGTNSSQAKALLYLTFAALGGSSEAQMSLGYRYKQGNTVQKSCEQALAYYRRVAEKVENNVQVTGGTVVERKRITEDHKDNQGHSQEDLVQYYKYNAVRGDVQAQAVVGQLYYQGGHGIEQNYDNAFRFLEQAADNGDANSMAALGEMHQLGLGTEGSNKTAFAWYKRAADKNSPAGHNGLGLMYLHGMGATKNPTKAFYHFHKSASFGHADGQLNLGLLFFNGEGTERDYRKALENFRLASQQGHVLGMYNLGYMHATGRGVARICDVATSLYKNVAERGEWAKTFEEAYHAYEDGRVEQAAVQYMLLGEMGYELGQHNAAYILDQEGPELFPTNGTFQRAFVNWKRSAEQGYARAHVKLGDYLFYGLGLPTDMAAAAAEYRSAVDNQIAQAMFNLGYMHENGLGLGQDLHLAKRYYDMAIETSTDAHVPAGLALLHLRLKFFLEWAAGDGQALYNMAMAEYSWGDVDGLITEWENVIFYSLASLLAAVILAHYSRNHPTPPA